MTEIYSDGSWTISRNTGGWACILVKDGKVVKYLNGELKNATVNRAELIAFIEGLKLAQEEKEVTVFTDSMYLVKGYKRWINEWKNKGWINAKGEPLKNSDLWRKVLSLKKDTIKVKFVKGHSGVYGNELADALAKY